MEEEIKEAFQSLGLSEKESKVYLSLLEYGGSSVKNISERSELNRVTVYPVLKSLSEKGFVSRYSMEKKGHFKAINPRQILDKMKEKEDKVRRAIPLLSSKAGILDEGTSVELFKGEKGISSFLEKMYSGEDRELWAYGNGELLDQIIKYQSLNARKIRIRRKIKLNILTNKVKRDYFGNPDYKKITKLQFNDSLKDMNIYIIFGKKKVGIMDLTKEINAVMITNEMITKYHLFMFNHLTRKQKLSTR